MKPVDRSDMFQGYRGAARATLWRKSCNHTGRGGLRRANGGNPQPEELTP